MYQNILLTILNISYKTYNFLINVNSEQRMTAYSLETLEYPRTFYKPEVYSLNFKQYKKWQLNKKTWEKIEIIFFSKI
jgi:hypothetical protein